MTSVLLIEDHQGARETISAVLRLDGFATAAAESGHAGLQLALSHSFDVIVIDLRLPDMSGIDVVTNLRAVGVDAPTVIVTAFPEPASWVDAHKCGATEYLEGPLFGSELSETILRVIGRQVGEGPGVCEGRIPQAIAGDTRVRRMVRAIERQPRGRLSATRLGALVGLSESRVRHLFQSVLGMSPFRLLVERRLQRAALLLRTGNHFTEVATESGLDGDLRRFRKAFKARFGISPAAYRRKFGVTGGMGRS